MTRSRTAGLIAAGVVTAAIGLSLAGPGVALAATDTVTNCNSSGAGSLPDVVASAAAGDTITFAPSPSCDLITLTSTLTINQDLTITGPGAANMAVSGGGTVGVLDITSGTVGISGLTIENGNNMFGAGGGISNFGTLTLTDSTVSGNTTGGHNGGGIDNYGGSVTLNGSTVSGNTSGGIDGAGDGDGTGGGISNDGSGGSVTLTDSTVSGNSAATFPGNSSPENAGGGISNVGNGNSVTLTGSTVSGNTALGGGGIVNDGSNSVTLTDSTVSGNTATDGSNGGGIANGAGTLTLIASTISGNTAPAGVGGGILYNATVNAAGTIVAGNTAGSGNPNCAGSGLTSAGYNLTDDASGSDCGFNQPTDKVNADPHLGPLGNNGGPTFTMLPGSGSMAVGMIPSGTSVTIGSNSVQLCPATDQRGLATAAGAACDAGAVQTQGSAPALVLKDSAAPVTFNAAGQVISYSYMVTNTGAGPLSGISVTDPAVPGISCPSPVLAAGTSEVCTGSYTTTAGDLAAGTITDTATANGTSSWLPVASAPATVTVAAGWPPAVTGTFRPAAGAAEGYYLGVVNNTWQLLVTHAGTGKVSFTGGISVPAGALGHLTLISPSSGRQVSLTGKVITFTLPDYGKVTGFSFTTTAKVTSITLTLDIGGHPAAATQIYLGSPPANPASGSPLTFTR